MAIVENGEMKRKDKGLNKMFKKMGAHPVPKHAQNYMYGLGGVTFLAFLVQVVTGILLAIYYKPTPELAYQSVIFIEQEVWMGRAIRSIHNVSANLMIISVVLHMLRVILTGSYKAPRHLNWMIGVTLLVFTLAFAFTGYLLPWDQLGYWGAVVATKMVGSLPIIGDELLLLLQAGTKITGFTLSRFYALHVVVLPVLAITFMVIHFLLIRTQGISSKMKRR